MHAERGRTVRIWFESLSPCSASLVASVLALLWSCRSLRDWANTTGVPDTVAPLFRVGLVAPQAERREPDTGRCGSKLDKVGLI